VLFAAVAAFVALRLKPAATLPPRVVAVAFSADSERLAAGLYNGTVQVWQTKSWRSVYRLHAEDGDLNTLEFSADSKLIAVAGQSLSLWTTSNARQWKRMGLSGAVYGTARFDKSGLHIASVNSSEQIELWSIQTGAKIRTLCCMALYGDLAFSPDNRLLAAAGHWPRLWDISTGREVYRLVQTRNPTFASIQFRSDGQFLATGSQDGIARVWRVSTGAQVFASPARQNYIETVAFQPGGDSIAYGVGGGPIWLWNLRTHLEQTITGNSSSNVAFSPDRRLLAFGTPGLVDVWDIDRVRELVRLRFPVDQ
jgi:WD40 repeat protein